MGFFLSSPYYFWRLYRRGNWQKGFNQRFGKFDSKLKQAITNRHTVWLHAVSVGEVNICTQLISALELRLPNVKFVVSTTTTTGMGELHKRLPAHISKIYYPIDARHIVRRALTSIRPSAILLVEAEIWPNFLWRASDLGTPVFLVNARLSERSFRGYRRFEFIFRGLFASFKGVGAQNRQDAQRLIEIGCRPDAVKVVGSLKFEAAQVDARHPLDVARLLGQIGVSADRPILVAGSTHQGEEAILARVYAHVRRTHPDLFLVIVPRHFERSREAAKSIEEQGLRCAFRTEITSRTEPNGAPAPDCLLVNTTGELKHFYRHATIVFVGKSLGAHGGQNPIEPGALGKPILFGPYMENFTEIARSFVSGGGAIQVQDEPALARTVLDLLDHPAKQAEMGERALAVVRENQGALARTVDMIVEGLSGTDVYIVHPTASAAIQNGGEEIRS